MLAAVSCCGFTCLCCRSRRGRKIVVENSCFPFKCRSMLEIQENEVLSPYREHKFNFFSTPIRHMWRGFICGL